MFISPHVALLAKSLDTPALDGHQVQAPHLVRILRSIYPLEFPGLIFGSTCLKLCTSITVISCFKASNKAEWTVLSSMSFFLRAIVASSQESCASAFTRVHSILMIRSSRQLLFTSHASLGNKFSSFLSLQRLASVVTTPCNEHATFEEKDGAKEKSPKSKFFCFKRSFKFPKRKGKDRAKEKKTRPKSKFFCFKRSFKFPKRRKDFWAYLKTV